MKAFFLLPLAMLLCLATSVTAQSDNQQSSCGCLVLRDSQFFDIGELTFDFGDDGGYFSSFINFDGRDLNMMSDSLNPLTGEYSVIWSHSINTFSIPESGRFDFSTGTVQRFDSTGALESQTGTIRFVPTSCYKTEICLDGTCQQVLPAYDKTGMASYTGEFGREIMSERFTITVAPRFLAGNHPTLNGQNALTVVQGYSIVIFDAEDMPFKNGSTQVSFGSPKGNHTITIKRTPRF